MARSAARGDIRRWLPAPVHAHATGELLAFPFGRGQQISRLEPDRGQQPVIVDGLAALRDRPQPELRPRGVTDLAGDEHIERRPQDAGHLGAHGDATTGQAQDQRGKPPRGIRARGAALLDRGSRPLLELDQRLLPGPGAKLLPQLGAEQQAGRLPVRKRERYPALRRPHHGITLISVSTSQEARR
jgi:hypothetical protein